MNQLEQGTDAWLLWRHNGLTASDCAAALGKSPYKTTLELYEEKIKSEPPEQDESKEFVFAKGHRLEALARNIVEIESGLDFPPILAEHENSFLKASLDGFCNGIVWEHKYASLEKLNALKERGEIPEHYMIQLMVQVAVTNANEVWFTMTNDKPELVTYTHKFKITEEHIKYIRDELYPVLEKFWSSVIKKTPPTISTEDTLQIKDKELGKLLTKYKNNKVKLDKATIADKELKEQIFKLASKHHSRVSIKNFTINQTTSKDSEKSDYQKYCEDNKIDMSNYTKMVKGRTTRRINFESN